MHCLMLLSSRRWLCALSGSVRGRISELMLSKGATGQCPLCSQKPTSLNSVAMSALCQKRTLPGPG
jgi:hypothetical protein